MRAIRDPETVKQAVKASVGSTIDVEPGGKPSGEPVRGKVDVATISDCRYTTIGPMITGMRFDVGPAIGLVFEGVDVAVVSGMTQASHNGQLRVVGFDPADYRIIVVKSAVHFRAWLSDVARAIVDDDPPGIATNELSRFEFSKKNHKLHPLDADTLYPGRVARHYQHPRTDPLRTFRGPRRCPAGFCGTAGCLGGPPEDPAGR